MIKTDHGPVEFADANVDPTNGCYAPQVALTITYFNSSGGL